MVSEHHPTRRGILKAVGGLSAAMALGGGSVVATASQAGAADGGAGLRVKERNEEDPRMWYYRFETDAIGWDIGPAVNVLLPDDYHSSGRTYPVLYLFHGGLGDFMEWDRAAEGGIRAYTAGRPLIVVMPDGGQAGWYSDPVSSNVGPRNWETFHMHQLLPWIEGNFRTYAEPDGRAVAGFSMGGFGALKYAVKYPDRFASVSAHSGPPSLRGDLGAVAHWANVSSAVKDLAGGTIYGEPWDEAKVSADNPMEHIESFRDKRIFLVAGTSPDPTDPFGWGNETEVLRGQREFKAALDGAGIRHESYEDGGGHFPRPDRVRADIEGIVDRLRKA
ncbi:alpha/beta hydrolase [Streptomyces sp. NBRC 110611]|uniref:alpha/beta hydrolase n=1 Tax=Streptomyces sp. NBRC 110611 TaxID=1621259 RepID=UPI00082BF2AB|nr:alpha/beta hydrolase-fold protein [Streptomyces sp. NBRC 110611]